MQRTQKYLPESLCSDEIRCMCVSIYYILTPLPSQPLHLASGFSSRVYSVVQKEELIIKSNITIFVPTNSYTKNSTGPNIIQYKFNVKRARQTETILDPNGLIKENRNIARLCNNVGKKEGKKGNELTIA